MEFHCFLQRPGSDPLISVFRMEQGVLTPDGQAVAERISQASLEIQNQVNRGIPEEDLNTLYRTLSILLENFDRLAE